GDVLQDEPGVDEVVVALLEVVGHDVVPADFEILLGQLLQEPGVEVGGHHPPARADPVAEPPGDGARPGADLEAAGAGRERQSPEGGAGPGVEDRLEEVEPAALVLPGVLEEVRHPVQAVSGPSGSLPFGVSRAVLKFWLDPYLGQELSEPVQGCMSVASTRSPLWS